MLQRSLKGVITYSEMSLRYILSFMQLYVCCLFNSLIYSAFFIFQIKLEILKHLTKQEAHIKPSYKNIKILKSKNKKIIIKLNLMSYLTVSDMNFLTKYKNLICF